MPVDKFHGRPSNGGDCATAGVFELTAINAAGGFNEFADQKRVRLLRGSEVKIFDVRQFRKNPGKDVPLQPGDRVEIPQTLF